MSKVDRHSLAVPEQCGLVDEGVHGMWAFLPGAKPVAHFETLRPGLRCGFDFKEDLPDEPDQVFVAWFTDDAGFRWQLDQYLHLVQADDESEYLP